MNQNRWSSTSAGTIIDYLLGVGRSVSQWTWLKYETEPVPVGHCKFCLKLGTSGNTTNNPLMCGVSGVYKWWKINWIKSGKKSFRNSLLSQLWRCTLLKTLVHLLTVWIRVLHEEYKIPCTVKALSKIDNWIEYTRAATFTKLSSTCDIYTDIFYSPMWV